MVPSPCCWCVVGGVLFAGLGVHTDRQQQEDRWPSHSSQPLAHLRSFDLNWSEGRRRAAPGYHHGARAFGCCCIRSLCFSLPPETQSIANFCLSWLFATTRVQTEGDREHVFVGSKSIAQDRLKRKPSSSHEDHLSVYEMVRHGARLPPILRAPSHKRV